jgi:hypothetical protein
MKIVLAFGLLLLGLIAPRLAGNRDTTTWLLWFIRRLFPALCFGTAIGLAIAAIRND